MMLNATESEMIANSTLNDTMNVTANYSATDVAPDHYPPHRNTFNFAMSIVIGIVGGLGNTMVIVVIRSNKDMRKKIINLFFVNQSAIDLACSITVCISGVCQYFIGREEYQRMAGWKALLYCYIVDSEFVNFSLFTASTYNLLALTFERYLEIVKPIWHKVHYTKKIAYITMAIVWVFGFVFTMLSLFPQSDVVDHICTLGLFPSKAAAYVHLVLSILIQILIPVVVLIGCYAAIVLSLRSRVGLENEASNPRAVFMARARRNMLRTLFTVLGFFFVCWFYSLVPYTMTRIGQIPWTFWLGPWGKLALLTPSINSIINPFIYTIQYQEFQRSLKKLIGLKREDDTSMFNATSETESTTRRDGTTLHANEVNH